MNTLLISLSLFISSQTIELGLLCSKIWIVDSRVSEDPRNIGDQIQLILFESDESAEIEMSYRYSGIKFSEDGIIRKAHWKKCGNDDGPSFSEGIWNLSDTEEIISITGISPWEGKYKVLELTSDRLIIEKIE